MRTHRLTCYWFTLPKQNVLTVRYLHPTAAHSRIEPFTKWTTRWTNESRSWRLHPQAVLTTAITVAGFHRSSLAANIARKQVRVTSEFTCFLSLMSLYVNIFDQLTKIQLMISHLFWEASSDDWTTNHPHESTRQSIIQCGSQKWGGNLLN